MYRALYRKWRPASFSDVIGQSQITTALQNQLSHNKIGHAYLFTGTRGTGKTTCAKIFAKAVNCEQLSDGNPCGVCHACKAAQQDAFIDIMEIDAASNNGVDHIRDLREESMYTPAQGNYKVYIIDEVHMLSTAAFNALLKIMEEPPSHVIFILATTEIHKVPVTILSRCQRYDFMRIPTSAIQERLLFIAKEEQISLSDDAAAFIARLCDGAMRDALSILDTCASVGEIVNQELVEKMAGVVNRHYLFDIASLLEKKEITKVILLMSELRERSIDLKRLCDELIEHYRNLLIIAMTKDSSLIHNISLEEENIYLEQAQQIPTSRIIQMLDRLCTAFEQITKGFDARICLEFVFLKYTELQQQVPFVQQISAVQYDLAPSIQQPVSIEPPKTVPTVSPTISAPNETPVQKELAVFEPWVQIIEKMRSKDALLFANLKDTTAYFDGKRVLIDGSELFLRFMRKNEYSAGLIKQVITEVTGMKYNIGPYPKPTAGVDPANENTVEDTLQHLSNSGVEVVYLDEPINKENEL